MSNRGGRRVNKNEVARRKLWNRDTSREASKLTPSTSITAEVNQAGKYFECKDLVEAYNPSTDQIESTFVKDQSATAKNFLRILGSRPSTGIELTTRQLDKVSGELVEGSDLRVLTRTATTLLRRGLPDQLPAFKRQTSGSKRIKFDQDVDFTRKRKSNPAIQIDLTPSEASKGTIIYKSKP